MSVPLSGMPDGTTDTVHVANTCVLARQQGANLYFRAFLIWLRASCPGDMTGKIRAEKFNVVPSTVDGFRATVGALRSLDGKKGVFVSHLLLFGGSLRAAAGE
jgi:hypothetical protein